MRVLLSSCGSRGDVEPQVALAVRLRALGARVRVCAPPNYADRLAAAGLPLVPVGEPEDAIAHAPKRRPRGSGPGYAAEVIAAQFDVVPAAAAGCDAVVASGVLSAAVGVRSVAEKLGIPYFYAFYSPVFLPSPQYPPPPPLGEPPTRDGTGNRALWERNNQGAFRRFGGTLNSHRAALGLPPVTDIHGYGFTRGPWLAADPVLAPLPPTDLDAVQTGAWLLPDERPLSPDLRTFLATGPPAVYVGFGSGPAPADAARVAVEAIRAHGLRAILARGWAGLALPDDGDDCLSVGEVNHQVLFTRVAAVVHAGSAGITTEATRAGVPQVVVSQMTDQPYFAGRVADLGIGVAHDGPSPTAASLAAALSTALSAGTRARAAAVAGTIRTDGTSVAANLLFDAAGRKRSPVPV